MHKKIEKLDTTDSKCLDVALALLELSLEYILYYQYSIGKTETETKDSIQEIIADMYHYLEQDYFLTQKDQLVVSNQIDNIKEILLQFLPETHSQSQVEPNVQDSN